MEMSVFSFTSDEHAKVHFFGYSRAFSVHVSLN